MQTIVIIALAITAAGLLISTLLLALSRAQKSAALTQLTTDRDRLTADLESTRTELADKATQLDTTLSRLHDLQLEHTKLGADHASLTSNYTKLEASIKEQEARLKDTFAKLAADQLDQTQKRFFETADRRFEDQRKANKSDVEQLVKPIADTLKLTDDQLRRIEKERVDAFSSLRENIKNVASETSRLTNALRKPHVRGQYGEIQLKRIAELAGMIDRCDFNTQATLPNGLRPDMIVNLPAGRQIVVDAKTNFHDYLEATNASSTEEAEKYLENFARHVAEQATALAKKNYTAQLDRTPDFIVMFIPGDQFIDAAVQRRPDLLEKAALENVILASPTTLIALLKAVAVGWREATIAEEAKALYEIGRQLHERARIAFEKLAEVGKYIDRSAKKYNEVVGSIDSRLMPALRKFEESKLSSGKNIADLPEVTVRTRSLDAASETTPDQT